MEQYEREGQKLEALTCSVPEAGRALGARSKDLAYRLAHEGVIPTIRVGRLLRVPIRALEQMLDRAAPSRKDT